MALPFTTVSSVDYNTSVWPAHWFLVALALAAVVICVEASALVWRCRVRHPLQLPWDWLASGRISSCASVAAPLLPRSLRRQVEAVLI